MTLSEQLLIVADDVEHFWHDLAQSSQSSLGLLDDGRECPNLRRISKEDAATIRKAAETLSAAHIDV